MWTWVGQVRPVVLDDSWANSVLDCPDCGDQYLHQSEVIVDKDQDVAILFWCENCSHRMTMDKKLWIRQHKGNTHLEWEMPIFPRPCTYAKKDHW